MTEQNRAPMAITLRALVLAIASIMTVVSCQAAAPATPTAAPATPTAAPATPTAAPVASPTSTPYSPPDFAGRTMIAQSFGNPSEAIYKESAYDQFERDTGGTITLVTIYSADALARVRAEKGNPQLDLAEFSGGQERITAAEGLSQPIDPSLIPNYANLADLFKDSENRWVPLYWEAEGIMYRTDKMPFVPTSFADFWRPEVQGHIAFPDISNTYGLHFLLMAAKTNGGSEDNVQPGFEAVKEIASQATIFKTNAEAIQLLSQGDIWMMWYSLGVYPGAQDQTPEVQWVTPEEGFPAGIVSAVVAAGGRNADMAQTLINYKLQPETQLAMATEILNFPTITNVELPAELSADWVPKLENLIQWDLPKVIENRPAWTEQWQREIAAPE